MHARTRTRAVAAHAQGWRQTHHCKDLAQSRTTHADARMHTHAQHACTQTHAHTHASTHIHTTLTPCHTPHTTAAAESVQHPTAPRLQPKVNACFRFQSGNRARGQEDRAAGPRCMTLCCVSVCVCSLRGLHCLLSERSCPQTVCFCLAIAHIDCLSLPTQTVKASSKWRSATVGVLWCVAFTSACNLKEKQGHQFDQASVLHPHMHMQLHTGLELPHDSLFDDTYLHLLTGLELPHDCKMGVCMTCPAKLVRVCFHVFIDFASKLQCLFALDVQQSPRLRSLIITLPCHRCQALWTRGAL